MTSKRLLVVLVAALCLALPAASSARAPVLESLNAQRAAHGLPAGIVEDASMSAGCNAHVNYMKLNNFFGHDEDPSKPGYTEAGDKAGNSSVLAGSGWPKVEENPFEFAPLHLAQLLAPALSVTGFDDQGICVHTWPGYQRVSTAPIAFYSYPGPATTGWRYQEWTSESPFTPAEFLGLPNPTGPHIYLYPFGVGAYSLKLTASSITGPQGAVEARAVSSNDGTKVAPYLPGGAIVIAAKPLEPLTRYTVSSTWQLKAPSIAFSEAETIADMKRIWTLFSLSEADQAKELTYYNQKDSTAKFWQWDDLIKVCEKAASGSLPAKPYNKILPPDTPCRTVKNLTDERFFTTGPEEKRENDDFFDNEEEEVTAVRFSARGKGRKVTVKMAAHPSFQGQDVRFTFAFTRGGKTKKIKRKVTLSDVNRVALRAPFKSGRVRLTISGRVQATDLYGSQSLRHRYSWRVR